MFKRAYMPQAEMRSETQRKAKLDSWSESDLYSATVMRNFLEANSSEQELSPAPPDSKDRILEWLNEKKDKLKKIIVFGAGGNGEIEQLLANTPDTSLIIVVEDDLHNAVRLFDALPVDRLALEKRLFLIPGNDVEKSAYSILTHMKVDTIPDIQILDLHDQDEDISPFYAELLKQIYKMIRVNACNISTLIKWGLIWQENALRNLPRTGAAAGK